jgi:hypothetical protein
MASPQETGHRHARGRTEETVRWAKLHLFTASNVIDCAATAITRTRELAAEREGSVRSSPKTSLRCAARRACLWTCSASEGWPTVAPAEDVSAARRPACPGPRRGSPSRSSGQFVPRAALTVAGQRRSFPRRAWLSSKPGPGRQAGTLFLQASHAWGGIT